jgi:MoCo/4Fe-4S cofactor protein with predicted Tat translocation signal
LLNVSSLNKQLHGREYWRSLQELAQAPEVQLSLEQEFPSYAPEELPGTSRRGFLKVMAASMALAGLTNAGCRRWPEQEVRPHSSQPEGTAPGVPQYYATVCETQGVATGLLAKSYDGRPIKIEGNAKHPFSLGAADARAQASVLDLYDPDRSRRPLLTSRLAGEGSTGKPSPRTWEQFTASTADRFAALRAAGGAGLAVLSRPTCGPTLLRLRREMLQLMPQARWHVYEPLHRDAEIAGAISAFGQPVRPQYHLEQAKVIACFDVDLLGLHPAHQRYARDWSTGRAGADRGQVNRVYAVESAFTLTGSIADHRLPVRPSRVGAVLGAIEAMLLDSAAGSGSDLDDAERAFAAGLAADLEAHHGRALVAVGSDQPAAVHATAHRLNAVLGNVGQTVSYTQEPLAESAPAGCVRSLQELARELAGGRVTTLLILDGNPVYDAPVDAGFDPAAAFSIHLASDYNETSARCRWHLPLAHYLECWGDGRAWDGTYSVQQPLIEPMFDGRSGIELMAMLLGKNPVHCRELVRQTAGELLPPGDFERAWEQLLDDGVLAGSAWPAVSLKASPEPPATIAGDASHTSAGGFELRFIASHGVLDGRHANNGWLQELPDPLTRLTWDNAALLSKADADGLGISSGDLVVVRVESSGRELEIVAYVMPGAAAGTLVLPLGYGRTLAGNVGRGVGFNTYLIRGSAADVASIRRTGRRYPLASTQEHHLIDAIGMWGRDKRVGQRHQSGTLIRESTAAAFAADPSVLTGHGGHGSQPLFNPPSLFNDPHAWGMAIDMDRCIGCAACVVGCQAENNIPIVGKDQVARTRHMHWLRVDRYFKGEVENPDVVYAPLACVHCENAPCEQVCPVAATVHDSEGLNTMVYNRCIGTRYCSNNCPYKVRRFNYFDYQSADPRGRSAPWLGVPDEQQNEQIDAIKRMIFNPEVTVRMRGVMEKCTYCVQRVQAAKIHASVEHAQGKRGTNLVSDGEVTAACQDACPTQAIMFGDLNDPNSNVSRLHNSPRAYAMLEELNLKPRTHYLAKLRNPSENVPAVARREGDHP